MRRGAIVACRGDRSPIFPSSANVGFTREPGGDDEEDG
jgi:hypothetical protein